MTIGINVCRSCTCCELTVDPTTGRCEDDHEAPPSALPYDNCGNACYTAAGHTMQVGRCSHAPEETRMTHTPTLGEQAYAAYGQTTDHLNYQGLPMPAWTELGDAIRRAWENAASAVHGGAEITRLTTERNTAVRETADLRDVHDALRARHRDFAETCANHSADRAAEQVAAETLVERLEAGQDTKTAIRDYKAEITRIEGI